MPELVGQAFHLRELNETDIAPWFERATDVEAADLAGDPVPESVDLGVSWLQRQHDHFRNGTGIRWAIVPTGSLVSVETIGLTIKPQEPVAELGVVIARANWGLGTAAAQLVTHYAFAVLGLAEIEAEALERNVGSIKLLEKAGFRRVCAIPPTTAEPETLFRYSLGGRGKSAA